jgi:hypothetical protein
MRDSTPELDAVCPEGQVFNDATDSCEACPEGLVPNESNDGCEACPEGIYVNGGCEACPEGQVPVTNDRCKPCPEGQVPNEANDGCEACPEGEIYVNGGCEACPEGQFPNEANDGCAACREGEIYVNFGCEACPEGQVPNEANDGCVACPEGQVPNEANDSCEMPCFKRKKGIALYGQTYKTFASRNVKACKKYCNYEPDCFGWSFGKQKIQGKKLKGFCYLVKDRRGATQIKGFVSGYKTCDKGTYPVTTPEPEPEPPTTPEPTSPVCYEKNTAFMGNTLDNGTFASDSAEDCQQSCLDVSDCFCWSFGYGTCRLKTSAEGRTPYNGYVSGFRDSENCGKQNNFAEFEAIRLAQEQVADLLSADAYSSLEKRGWFPIIVTLFFV